MPIHLRRWSRATAPLALSLFALTACTGGEITPPTPTSTTEPVFANEEEALAATVATYQAYLDVANQILHDGGSNPERIDAVVSAEVADIERESFARMLDRGFHTVGDIVLSEPKLREYYKHPDALGVVAQMFACEVISGVDVQTADGISQVPEGRPEAVGFNVSIGLTSSAPQAFTITAKEAEEGDSSCR
ncbi:hypothetical protein KXS11_08715 [Plantibacter flavus]|uniref:hypothetical protein n=1 Tax=Plantibacter flavus TaxID=150123 RepID=UPI003F16106E